MTNTFLHSTQKNVSLDCPFNDTAVDLHNQQQEAADAVWEVVERLFDVL